MKGRKKTKRFIDKKKATTYSLVHRSQNDPLANDADQPQMVLQASAVSIVFVASLPEHSLCMWKGGICCVGAG